VESLPDVSDLADEVLPLIRTRADLSRWSAANEHGRQMHEAVAILQQAAESEDRAVVFTVTQKAIASALKVIMRADDSSGIIGDACRALLDLHPKVAARAKAPVGKLVDWMINFQFDNECDFFHLDPVAYAPALGEHGMASYRAKLADREARFSVRDRRNRSGGLVRKAIAGSPWTGTPSGWRCSTAMSRQSSAPTPATRRWPRGCRTPPRHWWKSASSTWRSNGPGRRSMSARRINR
jgi:hypothetical protein